MNTSYSCPLAFTEEPKTLMADPTLLVAEQGPRLPCFVDPGDVTVASASALMLILRGIREARRGRAGLVAWCGSTKSCCNTTLIAQQCHA